MTILSNFQQKLQAKAADARERAVTYVALGDSVTQGCMQAGEFEYNDIYHQVVKRGIEKHYPGTVLNVVNSGVGGDTAEGSRSRWVRDVLMYKPDLVSICFGHNDAHGWLAGIVPFKQAITELVQKIREETEADILLIAPCMMTDRDNGLVADVNKPFIRDFIELAEQQILQRYVEAVREISRELNVPLFETYQLWEEMVREGEDIVTRLSNGINHPDKAFHIQWGNALLEMIFAE